MITWRVVTLIIDVASVVAELFTYGNILFCFATPLHVQSYAQDTVAVPPPSPAFYICPESLDGD